MSRPILQIKDNCYIRNNEGLDKGQLRRRPEIEWKCGISFCGLIKDLDLSLCSVDLVQHAVEGKAPVRSRSL